MFGEEARRPNIKSQPSLLSLVIGVATTVTLQRHLWAVNIIIAAPLAFSSFHCCSIVLVAPADSCSSMAILPHRLWSFPDRSGLSSRCYPCRRRRCRRRRCLVFLDVAISRLVYESPAETRLTVYWWLQVFKEQNEGIKERSPNFS